MKNPFVSIPSFVLRHPRSSVLFLWVIVAKASISIFTPLSEDFLTTGLLVAPTDFWTILRGDGPYLLWELLVKGIYEVWLLLPVDHPNVQSFVGLWYFFPSFGSQLLIFMLKLPLLVFDVLCAFSIYKIAFWYTGSTEKSIMGAALWFLNPYVTLVTEMFGAYDVIISFFFLVSILFFLEGDFTRSALALAASIFLKPYPLILLPLFITILARQWKIKDALKYASTVVLPIGILLVPLATSTVTHQSFMQLFDYYFDKGASFFLGFTIESYVSKTGFISVDISLTFIFLLLYFFYTAESCRRENKAIFDAIFGFLLIIFAFSFWHPQLLIWMLPLVSLDSVVHRTSKIYPVLLVATAFLFELIYFSFYFTSHGHSFFFVPNYNSLLRDLSSMIYPLYKTDIWIGPIAIILRSTFVSVCIYYLVRVFSRNCQNTKAYGLRDL